MFIEENLVNFQQTQVEKFREELNITDPCGDLKTTARVRFVPKRKLYPGTIREDLSLAKCVGKVTLRAPVRSSLISFST